MSVQLAHAATSGEREADEREIAPVPPSEPERRGRERASRRAPPAGPMLQLQIDAGSNTGMRPGDIVGAIAGETAVSPREIGAIQIRSASSLVEVPEARADEIIQALMRTTLRGKRVRVRRNERR